MNKIPLPEPEISSGVYSGKYKEYKFDNAEYFYAVLSNFNDTIDEQKNWIFRGHWDSDSWGLVPSVLRKEWQAKLLLEPFKWVTGTPTIRKPQDINNKKIDLEIKIKSHAQLKYQIMIEYDLLEQFMDTAYLLGIKCDHIPSIYKHEKTIEKASLRKELEKWPYANVLPLMSLAQHHGVPTRLLDFSYNPLLASFFSASYPFFEEYVKKNKKDKKDKRLCVWAIRLEVFKQEPFKIIDKPSKVSKNLLAQEGLLILHKKASQKFIDDKEWWDFQSMATPETFIKFSLPQKEYKELLYLLWNDDMTPAKTKPNLDNVVQTMEYIQWLWAKKYKSKP